VGINSALPLVVTIVWGVSLPFPWRVLHPRPFGCGAFAGVWVQGCSFQRMEACSYFGTTSMVYFIDQGRRADSYVQSSVTTAFLETVCSWTLRLILPVLLGAGGLLFYWVWIDGEHTMVTLRIAAMIPLCISFIAIAIWTFKEWLPPIDAPNRGR
jgi:hypothetical protein